MGLTETSTMKEATMSTDQSRLSRREFATAAALAAASLSTVASAAPAPGQRKPIPGGEAEHASYMDNLPLLKVGLVLFSKLTAMDLVGPQMCLRMMMKTDSYIVAQSMDPVMAEDGYAIVPTATFADCPKDLDVLLVPGGPRGTELTLRDDALLDFVADRGSRARYVTSVCTGSVTLAAAGLLKGYRAASHWMTLDLLPAFGAIPVSERVVIDRNRVTGGGITAGLDFGLKLASMLRNKDTARLAELFMEYNPEPPFRSGSMQTAHADTVALARKLAAPMQRDLRLTADQARARRAV